MRTPPLAFMLLVLPASCRCVSEPAEFAEASVDAGDAAVTADVTDSEASAEANHGGYGPFPGEWRAIPGAELCDGIFALEPAKAIPKLRFAACASGRTGCRALVVDWTTKLADRLISFDPEPVRLIRGIPYMTYGKYYPLTSDPYDGKVAYSLMIVQALDDEAVLASGRDLVKPRQGPSCGIWALAGEFGFVLNSYFPSAYPAADVISWASWSAPSTFATNIIKFVSYEPSGIGAAGRHVVGGARVFLSTTGPSSVAVYDPAMRRGSLPVASPVPRISEPLPVGGGALVYDFTGMNGGIAFLGNDARYTNLLKLSYPRFVSQIAVDRSSDNAIVWVEAEESATGATNPVLWTSPFATSPEAFKPTKVTAVKTDLSNGLRNTVVNRGVALSLTGRTTAQVTRLSDGVSWKVDSEPGVGFALPLWVDDDEVWIATGDSSKDFVVDKNGILRIRRESLGPSSPPLP